MILIIKLFKSYQNRINNQYKNMKIILKIFLSKILDQKQIKKKLRIQIKCKKFKIHLNLMKR